MGLFRLVIGIVAGMLFAITGFVASNEGGDLNRTYVWLGLSLAAAIVTAAIPRQAEGHR